MLKERESVSNIFLLQNSGFDASSQMESFDPENLADFIAKTREDLNSFVWEFVKRRPVLFSNFEIQNNTVVCPNYRNAPLEKVVDEYERDGAVKIGIQNTSQVLVNAPVNSVTLLTSPSGWSNNRDDITLHLPESQTYFYWKKSETEIEAITVRSDMELADHERLIGLPVVSVGEKDRIKDVVTSPRLILNSDLNNAVMMLPNDDVWGDSGITYTKGDVLRAINFKEKFQEMDEGTQELIDNFLQLADVLQDADLVAEELGKTVMKITKLNREGKTSDPIDYARESVYVSSLEGCVAVETSVDTPFGARSALLVENGKKYLICKCPFCKRTKVKAEISGGYIKCPNCKKSVRYRC